MVMMVVVLLQHGVAAVVVVPCSVSLLISFPA
jgi:hypothetical protein